MKVAIDTSPLQSGHAVRGVGYYLRNLLLAIEKYHPEIELQKVNLKSLPDEGYDVFHFPYFDPFFLTLPRKFTKPTVITIHDLTPLKFPHLFPSGLKGTLKWQLQRQIARKADVIITDSEHSKKDIKHFLQIPNEKIHVVYLAAGEEFCKKTISEKEKQELIKKYSLPEKFVLYVGDATPNKNLPVLLDAIKIANVPLVLVGKSLTDENIEKNNKWNKDLLYLQDKAKQRSDIHLLGFVPTDELVKLYNIASVFVQPSFYEGFGLPLLEAMSCGAPTITTSESSLPEVGGDAPLYVNHNNPNEMAGAIKKILTDTDLREKMKIKSLEQSEIFSWKKTAGKTADVYKNLIL